MFEEILKRESKSVRIINAITVALSAFSLALTYRLVEAVYFRDMKEVWSVMAPLAASYSAILVAYTAKYSIQAADRRQKEESRLKSAATLHYMISMTNFIRDRLRHLSILFTDETERPIVMFTKATKELALHYEKLHDRENFHVLPGPTIDKIISLSAVIFALECYSTLAVDMWGFTTCQKLAADSPQVKQIESELKVVEKILDDLYEARRKIS